MFGFLLARGYDATPVNPLLAGRTIHGRTVVASLADAAPLDMVDIFRASANAGAAVDEAIRLGARMVWMQLGVVDEAAADTGARGRHHGGDGPLPGDRSTPTGPRTPLNATAPRRHIARHGTQRVAPMTNEERDIITQFIARVSGAQRPASRRSAARCRRPRRRRCRRSIPRRTG